MPGSVLSPYYKEGVVEAGCDEAGRGCLAGPVVAAAVILSPDFSNDLLNDSKKLSQKQRLALRPVIEKEAIAWAIGIASNEEIDRLNILNASFIAMNRAVNNLAVTPGHLLIDGNRFRPLTNIPFSCMVKGDGRFSSVAAASVLAKTYRDELMEKLHGEFPLYEWNKNKGYPTKKHREAIAANGISKYHRLSFRLSDEQLRLQF